MSIVLGSSIQVFVSASHSENNSLLLQEINDRVLYLLGIGAGAMVASYIQAVCWMVSGENIATRIREAYLQSLLRQDIQILDGIGAGQVTTSISCDINIIQDTISHKTGLFISSLSTFLSAFIIAFIRNWRLAIIVSAILPAMVIPTAVMSMFVANNVKESSIQASLAHTVAADAISSINAVKSLGIQDVMTRLYDDLLRRSERFLFKRSFWLGSIYGYVFLVLFSAYSLAFWEGSRLLASDQLHTGIVVNVLFSVIIGTLALGRVTRFLESLTTAISVSTKILETIGRENYGLDSEPKVRSSIQGNILFQNVSFAYASLPDVLVLDDISLHILPRKTTAIVGASGSGKSTIIGLLERFYEPTSGQILIDGIPITALDLSSFRSQMSLVSQEPTLFSTTIFENVCMGLLGTSFEFAKPYRQLSMVMEACKLAGISEFIETLPDGYDTFVGSKGVLLSGGQKQRLAFARAIVRDPKVLILDEPTSALDQESESIIQAALDTVSATRTIIILAHKLHTIKKADSIIVIGEGKVLEQGTHEDLSQSKGAYFSLLQAHQNPKTSEYDREKAEITLGGKETFLEGDNARCSPPPVDVLKQTEKPEWGITHYFIQVLRLNGPEIHLIILGFLASIICGAIYPIQAFLFAKMLVLSGSPQDASFGDSVNFYSLMFFVIALVKCVSQFTSSFALGVCCNRMIGRVRSTAFRNILRQNIEWFHGTGHSTGRLIFSLSRHSHHLAGLHGSSIAIFIDILTNLTSSAIFSLVVSWQYSLPVLCVIPFIIIAGYLRLLVLKDFENAISEWHKYSTEVACEAIASIRTVAALVREKQILETYRSTLKVASKLAYRSILRSSALYSLSQSLVFLVNAFAIWYGGRLMVQGRINLFQNFAVYMALTFGAQDAGEMVGRVPELALAKTAAASLVELGTWESGRKEHNHPNRLRLQPKTYSICFENVFFAYQARPERLVLSGVDLTIQPGQHIAIVGASGSGKSTILGLLCGFFTPSSGTVKIGGIDVSSLDSQSYSSLISLVPQDPVLFPGTIQFNILLGASDPSSVTHQDMEEACREANILDFIQSLPEGFETSCNNTSLSTGQKQRLVIARAVIRNPKILLLDEPTASLDALSVNHVLTALESASKARTTIILAHNISSLLRVDRVYNLEQGRILESSGPSEGC
jgi:ATP-binding cassette, subfamily B (MDR/TAP), member 1